MPLGHYHQRRRRICGEVGEGAAHCGGPGGAIQIPDLGEDGVFDDHLPRCVQHSYEIPLKQKKILPWAWRRRRTR